MKTIKTLTAIALTASFLAAPLVGFAQDSTPKAKAYPLTTCVVTGEKLGDGGMKPYVFTYKGQEVKLCCKSCLKKFDQDPAKYMAKIKEGAAKK
jgi:YHS domain-containing protein